MCVEKNDVSFSLICVSWELCDGVELKKVIINIMALKVNRVPENIDFPKEEENILKFWKEIDAFHSCLKQSKNKPR